LIARLVHGIAQQARAVLAATFEQASRALHVADNGQERLIEFMRQRGRHLAHRRQSRNMNELGL
jgi:hypothetical protein